MKNYILMTLLMVSSVAINGMDVEQDYKTIENLRTWMLVGASMGGSLDSVQRLIARNANVNCMDMERNHTPLSVAARNGHLEVCRALIAHKANICLKDPEDHTPLMRAAKSNNLEICELLVQSMLLPELKKKMCIFLGIFKHRIGNYHNMKSVIDGYYHPALTDLREINSPRVREEINRIGNEHLKARLLNEFFNQ